MKDKIGSTIPISTIPKDENHDHFWIDGGILYESYRTIRGLRSRRVADVPSMEDCDRCPADMLIEDGEVANG